MAPSLWPFARTTRADSDLLQLRACLPDVDRPIEWDNEASCAGYSVINMLKNSQKPQSTLPARLKQMARGFRRTPALSMALETMEGIRNVAIVAVRCCTLSLACPVSVAGAVSAVDAGSAPAAFGVGSGRGVGDAASGDEPADR